MTAGFVLPLSSFFVRLLFFEDRGLGKEIAARQTPCGDFFIGSAVCRAAERRIRVVSNEKQGYADAHPFNCRSVRLKQFAITVKGFPQDFPRKIKLEEHRAWPDPSNVGYCLRIEHGLQCPDILFALHVTTVFASMLLDGFVRA